MTKQNKENEKARKQLQELKEMYELTWPWRVFQNVVACSAFKV
ncbi:MAG: hypothetical protein ACYSTS_18595 [Planctomycetota bacterium]|jgi:hypothetical protein